MNKYIIDEYDTIVGVEGETTLYDYEVTFGGDKTYQYLVTSDEKYVSIYIIDDDFRVEPFNNLKFQDEIEYKDEYINSTMVAYMQVMEHYLWKKFSTNDEVLEFEIVVHKEKSEE